MSRALPATPGRWFSEDELRRSVSYHRPLRRAAQVADAVLMVVLALIWVMDPPVAAAAGTLAGVVVARAIGGDLVMDRVAEPSIGAAPLPLRRLLVSSIPVAALRGLMVGGAVVLAASSEGARWLLVIGVAAVSAVSLTVAERWFDLVHRPSDSSGAMAAIVADLAARQGATPPLVQATSSPAFPGPTAMTLGVRRPRIVVTDALEDADRRLVEWVVAHELAHVRRKDVARGRATMLMAVVVASSIGVLVGQSVDRTGARGVVAVFVAASVAWLLAQLVLMARSRSAERAADDAAAGALGPQPAVVRALVSGPRARLAPTWWERATAPHPTPAERIRRMSAP